MKVCQDACILHCNCEKIVSFYKFQQGFPHQFMRAVIQAVVTFVNHHNVIIFIGDGGDNCTYHYPQT